MSASPSDTTSLAPWDSEIYLALDSAKQFLILETGERTDIIGAANKWAEDPTLLISTGYRIAGSEEQIRAVLSAAGEGESQIDSVLNVAVSKERLTSPDILDYFLVELSDYDVWRRSNIAATVAAPGVSLTGVVAAVTPTAPAAKRRGRPPKGATTGTNSSPKSKTGTSSRRGRNLLERINEMPDDKVMDVSAIRENGAGAQSTGYPKTAPKYGIDVVRMVSTNLPHYLMGLDEIGGESAFPGVEAAARKLFARIENGEKLKPGLYDISEIDSAGSSPPSRPSTVGRGTVRAGANPPPAPAVPAAPRGPSTTGRSSLPAPPSRPGTAGRGRGPSGLIIPPKMADVNVIPSAVPTEAPVASDEEIPSENEHVSGTDEESDNEGQEITIPDPKTMTMEERKALRNRSSLPPRRS